MLYHYITIIIIYHYISKCISIYLFLKKYIASQYITGIIMYRYIKIYHDLFCPKLYLNILLLLFPNI